MGAMQKVALSHSLRTGLAAISLITAALAGCASAAPAASEANPASQQAELEAGFARWVDTFRAYARTQGIGEETLRVAFENARYVARVVDRDGSQPEFTRAVWDYIDRSLTPARVSAGLDKMIEVQAETEAAAARYGVPPGIVVAIWGLESNFGANVGNIPTIDALATLGFEGRREAWAREQLIAALRILQSGDIAPAQMVGSWAGAMGQTQFLPSSFLAYAVDGDGDGRRDIWGSTADVVGSTANFLARSGWQGGQPWGVEVRLPAGFDLARADASNRRPSVEWAAEGVESVDGGPLPPFDDGSILLPAGARGPAFLVGPNFRALLRYNNSNSYALSVGLLAQRLAGGLDVQAPWPRDLQALTRDELKDLQTALNERGFGSGTPDGLMGPRTRDGIRRYQQSIGVPADGYPTLELLESLRAPAPPVGLTR